MILRYKIWTNKKLLVTSFVVLSLLWLFYGTDIAAKSPGWMQGGFVKTEGTHFTLNGEPFYFSGFNAYWLLSVASDPSTKGKVTDTFRLASEHGLKVVRTWAFNDGAYKALQMSPGLYDEDVFKALDFVVSEAKKYGIYLILSLVDQWKSFGGRKQYVQWAREQGQNLTSDDEFFNSPVTKMFYKNHVRAVLTRVNSISKTMYRDDSTIFAWELMNEIRCESDLSGKTIQDWVVEMSAYVKSIDANHLLEIGLDGYYGPEKRESNPGGWLYGTDYISNNQITGVDFGTIHLYPDKWFNRMIDGENMLLTDRVLEGDDKGQLDFVKKWIQTHADDSQFLLGKPLVLAEYGKLLKPENTSRSREECFRNILREVYQCARDRGPCGGALLWQVLPEEMESWSDGYDISLARSSSTIALLDQHSHLISSLK